MCTESRRIKRLEMILALTAALLACNLIATGVLLGMRMYRNSNEQMTYTLYIGTNDKDTYQQESRLTSAAKL